MDDFQVGHDFMMAQDFAGYESTMAPDWPATLAFEIQMSQAAALGQVDVLPKDALGQVDMFSTAALGCEGSFSSGTLNALQPSAADVDSTAPASDDASSPGTTDLEDSSDGTSPNSEAPFDMPSSDSSFALSNKQLLELCAMGDMSAHAGDAGTADEAAYSGVPQQDADAGAPQQQFGDGVGIDPRKTLLSAPAAANQTASRPERLDDDESHKPPSHRRIKCGPCNKVLEGGVKSIPLHVRSNRHLRNIGAKDWLERHSCLFCKKGLRLRSFTRKATLKRHIMAHHPELLTVTADGSYTVPDDILEQGKVKPPK
jgi:hypothetical protein